MHKILLYRYNRAYICNRMKLKRLSYKLVWRAMFADTKALTLAGLRRIGGAMERAGWRGKPTILLYS